MEEGRVPSLKALQLFNSTVYRWNRACYGVADNVAHLRIENRVLPCGPSVRDEVANAAFWFGLLSGLAEEVDDIREVIAFPKSMRGTCFLTNAPSTVGDQQLSELHVASTAVDGDESADGSAGLPHKID